MQINLQELPDEIVQAKQRYGIVGNAPGLFGCGVAGHPGCAD